MHMYSHSISLPAKGSSHFAAECVLCTMDRYNIPSSLVITNLPKLLVLGEAHHRTYNLSTELSTMYLVNT